MDISENTEPEPTRQLFKTNETSSQSTTLVQNETERSILVFRDELSGLLVKCNREGGQDERVYFLEGWNGAGSYTGFKIGRGLIDAKKICISLLAGIQRQVKTVSVSSHASGVLQRLLLAVWPNEPKSGQNVDTYPYKEAATQSVFDISTLAVPQIHDMSR